MADDMVEWFDTGLLPLTSTDEICWRDAFDATFDPNFEPNFEPTPEPTALERPLPLARFERVLPIALWPALLAPWRLRPPVALSTLAFRLDPRGPCRLMTADSRVEPMREATCREPAALLAMLLPTWLPPAALLGV